jgi:hypothetical protein
MRKTLILDITPLMYRGVEKIVPDFDLEFYIAKYYMYPGLGYMLNKLIDFLTSKGFNLNYEYLFRFLTELDYYIVTRISELNMEPKKIKAVKTFNEGKKKYLEVDVKYEVLERRRNMIKDLYIEKHDITDVRKLIDEPTGYFVRNIVDLDEIFKDKVDDKELREILIKVILELSLILEFELADVDTLVLTEIVNKILSKELNKKTELDENFIKEIIEITMKEITKDIKRYIEYLFITNNKRKVEYSPYGWIDNNLIIAIKS